MNQYASDWYEATLDPSDKLPAAVSIDSTPQEILTLRAFELRYVFTLEGQDREKALVAIQENGQNSDAFPIWENFSQQLPNALTGKTGQKVFINQGALKTESAQSSDGLQIYGPSATQIIHTQSGSATFYYEKYKNPLTGQNESTWLQR